MKLMRNTVAGLVAATFSLTAMSAFAAANLTGAGGTFPSPLSMLSGLMHTRKQPVLRLTIRASVLPAA